MIRLVALSRTVKLFREIETSAMGQLDSEAISIFIGRQIPFEIIRNANLAMKDLKMIPRIIWSTKKWLA